MTDQATALTVPDGPRRRRRFNGDRHPRGVAERNAAATHCIRGHQLDDANVYRWVDGRGYTHRQCRACNKIRARQRQMTAKGNRTA